MDKWFLFVNILFLVSCAVNAEEIPQPNVTPTLANPQKPLSASTVPAPTPTLTPLWHTYLPTYSFEEGTLFISNLIASNGNCELPCVWGIMPEKTATDILLEDLGPYGVISEFEKKDGRILYTFFIPETFDTPEFDIPIEVAFISEDGIVEEIHLHGKLLGPADYSQISSVLVQLGKPDRIVAGIYPESQIGPGNYELFLLYLDKQVSIRLINDFEILESELVICPQSFNRGKDSELFFQFWSFSDATDLFSVKEIEGLPSLSSSIPEYSTDIFYETFSKPNTSECIPTGFLVDE